MAARIEHLVTSGTFSLDGQTFDVDNNVWLLGDDDEVIVSHAPHDPDAIEAAVGDRTVVAIACTHAHDDHVRSAPELAERLSTQSYVEQSFTMRTRQESSLVGEKRLRGQMAAPPSSAPSAVVLMTGDVADGAASNGVRVLLR